MSMQSHLMELERRHQALDRELETVIARPSSDDREIAELKRRKLVLKDEITRLKSAAPSVH